MRDIKIGNLKRVMGNTENGSSQPAMRVKRRGEKSLAGLTADPAFKPKLGIFSVRSIFHLLTYILSSDMIHLKLLRFQRMGNSSRLPIYVFCTCMLIFIRFF